MTDGYCIMITLAHVELKIIANYILFYNSFSISQVEVQREVKNEVSRKELIE